VSATTSKSCPSFVLLTLTGSRFALPAEAVLELVVPGSLQTFPSTTPLILGVLVRRGQVVPVVDVSQVVSGRETQHRKFYLIASRIFGKSREGCAIPVMGDCELIQATPEPREEGAPLYVKGVLPLAGDRVPVLDLDAVFATSASGAPGPFAEALS